MFPSRPAGSGFLGGLMGFSGLKTLAVCAFGIAVVGFLSFSVKRATNYGAQVVEIERLAEAQARSNLDLKRKQREVEVHIKTKEEVEAKYGAERLKFRNLSRQLENGESESKATEGIETCPSNCLLQQQQ